MSGLEARSPATRIKNDRRNQLRPAREANVGHRQTVSNTPLSSAHARQRRSRRTPRSPTQQASVQQWHHLLSAY
eukprot:7721576-Lingulodinium_polyedra.AAC.1